MGLVSEEVDEMAFFQDLGLIMMFIGLGFLVAEIVIPGFWMAVPGTGFFVTGIVLFLIPDTRLNNTIVALIFLIGMGMGLVISMALYRILDRGGVKEEVMATGDELVGSRALVESTVIPNLTKGKVRIEGEIWSATSDEEIPEGNYARVLRRQGIHLVVSPWQSGSDPMIDTQPDN